jgi:hypothetical protein
MFAISSLSESVKNSSLKLFITFLDHSYNYLPILAIILHQLVGRLYFLSDYGLQKFTLLGLAQVQLFLLCQKLVHERLCGSGVQLDQSVPE